jgi:beta-mannosidase
MGHAWIEAYKEIAVRNIRFVTNKLSTQNAEITIYAEIENLYPISTMDVNVRVDMLFGEKTVHSIKKEIFMTSGINYIKFDLTVKDPEIWWPNGMGDQNLYTVKVFADTLNNNSDLKVIKTGIRTIKLNTEKIDNSSRMFLFEINGIKTFCKGGNWETPDSIYGRVSDDKYEALVREAKEANFNMLRMNGGTSNERDYFYECCDRYGILIWQDFMGFSCAAYPDELDWFKAVVEKEVEYQIKRLRSHPCLVLWCGNNECHAHLATYREGGYWAGDKKPASPGGMVIYNEIMPRIIRNNSPDIPYWNSSPYGGREDLNCDEYGDVHNWVFMSSSMEERIDPREYDKVNSKFASEFGCIGPVKKSSLFNYYGSKDIDMESGIWKMHTNTFEKNTVRAAIAKHYTDKKDLSLDEYLLFAGLFQGMMLGYAIESMRIAENNYGSLIWSFNDAWGEIGWSIIDYYLVRKISYYFVKRSLSHKKLMIRQEKDNINIYCANDTKNELVTEIEYGYVSFDGKINEKDMIKIEVGPFTKSKKVVIFEKGDHDMYAGVFYARPVIDETLEKAVFTAYDFKDLKIPQSSIKVIDHSETKSYVVIESDGFSHGVHFDLDDETKLSDEYFDMLPGEIKKVYIKNTGKDIDIKSIKPGCVI